MRSFTAAFSLLFLSLFLTRPTRAAAQVMDSQTYSLVLFDLLEYQSSGSDRPVTWDALGWIGGDFTRLWIKSEGARATRTGTWDMDVQALYGRLIAPFWDFQAGARVETRSSRGVRRTRGSLVVGLQGLAPYWFELEPALFVSEGGDLSARLTVSYDLYLAQRLVAQPRMELNAAVQRVPEFGVGSGLNDLDLGLRVRYEVRREFAPYIGVGWASRFSETASLARSAGEATSRFTVVGGVRVWF